MFTQASAGRSCSKSEPVRLSAELTRFQKLQGVPVALKEVGARFESCTECTIR